MKKIAVIGFWLILLSLGVQAQRSMVGFNIKAYQPVSSLNKNLNGAIPGGISLNYVRNPVKSFSYGAEIGVAMYASNDYLVDYNGGTIEVNEEDCFWTIHGLVRYNFFQNDKVISYIEGRMGVTTFFSNTMPLDEGTGYKGEFEVHGTAFNTGIGPGILYKVGSVWLNAGVNFHGGTKSTYRYMPESDQTITFDEGKYRSLTHYVGYKLGIQFTF